jgi:TPR repeat protein
MKRSAIAIVLAASLISPAWADLDRGTAAYRRGDFVTAHREFLAPAQKGEARAQFSLALLYLRGQGVAQDTGEAMRWLRKAANRGDGEARLVLGDLYMKGPPPRDYVKSYMWLILAVANIRGPKRKIAFRLRKQAAAHMTPEQIAQAKKMARDWRALER